MLIHLGVIDAKFWTCVYHLGSSSYADHIQSPYYLLFLVSLLLKGGILMHNALGLVRAVSLRRMSTVIPLRSQKGQEQMTKMEEEWRSRPLRVP